MKLDFSDEEMLGIVEEEYKGLPKTVKEFISNRVLEKMFSALIEINLCESPIEQLMGVALHEVFPKTVDVIADDFFINPQEKIEYNGKDYRVDFFVVVNYKNKIKGYVIECDGHEFHEKTKEQARRDKQRDRDLMTIGHPVMRFTGSEIYDNPILCAREAASVITNDLMSWKD